MKLENLTGNARGLLSPRADLPLQSGARRKEILPTELRQVVLHGLAIIGCVHLFTQLWSPVMRMVKCQTPAESQVIDDIYSDTDYPLRPALEPWDISKSYPYARNFSKTVTEGTWLRIATHPTQHEIVFDMLGDLYCMSTKGSSDNVDMRPARPFLTGIPFDKEAEFSHDGSQLVFVSDAGFGVDNIWTMPYTNCGDMARLAPEDVRGLAVQQTNATFRFFSSPAFHPTEPKLIATKWFLTGRPNGAGEIWEFPLLAKTPKNLPERGGRRLIARQLPPSWPTERYFESQLGAEQARYTPSGDGLIFTRNSKDHDSGKFSYNKDVHAGINSVHILNLTTGHTDELVAATASAPNKPASPGGASMPRLSRDGRTLAFVRRVDDKSVLVLKDMVSGTVHYVWDGLTYDLSMIPAFMGAYPNYGWAEEDSELIIWSQGQIWRLPLRLNTLGERVVDGTPSILPFEATIELSLGTTRYSKTNILESELSTRNQIRSLRGLRSDYLGQQVVVEAAGDNYIVSVAKDSASAAPMLLPKPSEDVSCYSPSFVHESPFILQACWDSKNLTSFFLADPGQNSTQLIRGLPRGKYISPVSNGQVIAYVRTGKDYMFGDVEETFGEGVWVGRLSRTSGTADAVTISALLHIKSLMTTQETKLDIRSVAGRTVLVVDNPTSVVEYDIESGNQKVIVTGKTSVEMTSSNQGANLAVAFRDFQQVWLSMTAQSNTYNVWSKPGDHKTPGDVIRLSEQGGHDVTISGDGKTTFWLYGPNLHYVEISKVSKSCEGSSSESRDSGKCSRTAISTKKLEIQYQTALGQQIGFTGGVVFAITNASLISMDLSAPVVLSNATILVREGEIIAVGSGLDVDIPPNSEVLNVGGGAVLPGFVDVHGHWGGFLSPYPQPSWEMETFLGYGVTTIHNPASKNVAGMVERHLIEKGRMYGPRVFHTGDVLYGSTQPNVYTEINSLADARDALLRVKVEGGNSSFSVKNYQLVPRSARQRLLLEATELDMLVVPEGGWSLDWDLTYFIDGYTSLEHPVPVPELYDDILSLIAASGSSYTPLAVMNYGGIFGQHWIHQSYDIPQDQKLRNYVKHDILESLTEVKKAPRSSYQFFNTTKSTAKLASRGVRTNVGAHGEQPIGYLFHSEMQMMAMGGQDPYDVLRHATIGGATSLGLDVSIGSVKVGKLADLVIYPVGVNTVETVWHRSMHMKHVMRGGTLFSVDDGLVETWPRRGRKQTRACINPDDTACM